MSDITTSSSSAPDPLDGVTAADIARGIERTIERLQFEASMAGEARPAPKPCACDPGYRDVISHLSPAVERERWKLDELRAALQRLGHVLLGVRRCTKCNDAQLLYARSRDMLPRIVFGKWSAPRSRP